MSPVFWQTIEASITYHILLIFFASYPIVSSLMWTSTAIAYWLTKEKGRSADPLDAKGLPFVSVLIPCYCEGPNIAATLRDCLALDYPLFEVVVVDDGSHDSTVAEVLPFVDAGQVRLISKRVNEGKAMAMNDAIPCLRGEVVVIMDADASPFPDMLRHLTPHFSSGRVAAVTGNPRVADRDTLLSKLQLMEFTSIVSLQRRAQRVWGRILTVSGVVTAFRKSALVDAGLFSPDMATEDIDMTWKLQKKHYDIRYEPAALVWMHVPRTLPVLWKQRRRWALGLAQVLRRHTGEVMGWKHRRMWPILAESMLSILWAYVFVGFTVIWIGSYAAGVPPVGASPFPNWWGMTIATLSLLQLAVGMSLDRRYDRTVARYFAVAVYYPLLYWLLMAVVTTVTTPLGFTRGARGPQRWQTPREEAQAMSPEVDSPELAELQTTRLPGA